MQGHISSNAFANTIKFLPLPILYMMIIGLSYIFLFFSLLAIAWGSHCKTIGKPLVGGYFIYPFIPYMPWNHLSVCALGLTCFVPFCANAFSAFYHVDHIKSGGTLL